MAEPSFEIPPLEKSPEKRLDSWKEIAAYLNRDVTTVQRWEKREAMPVHRHVHERRGSVYASPEELDAWIKSRSARLDESNGKSETELPSIVLDGHDAKVPRKLRLWLALAAAIFICLVAATLLLFRHRSTATAQPAIRSLAVLPLRNLSGDPAQDYLADGMTEALTGRLSKIHSLRVISYTSVVRFKDSQLSAPEIARMLNVDALVEGSVIREGSRIRVTAQLIRGVTDEHFWSESYDREMRDALVLESELAQAIAEKVEVTVSGEEHERLTTARTVAPEVYESYLKGKFILEDPNNTDWGKSIPYFEDAVNKDPTFAPAYLGLANVYTGLGMVFAGNSPVETRPKALSFVRKALVLDPDLAEGHVILGNLLQEEWHWSEAETEYKRALELDPNSAGAHAGFALWLLCEGHTDEAVEWMERARELDPVAVSGGAVSSILFQARRYDEAIREGRSELAVQPNDALTMMNLGFALVADNQPTEAIPVLEKAISLTKASAAVTGILIRAYAHAGRRTDALQLLEQLKRSSKARYIPAGAFVNAYLGLGDKERAFYWLEQAYREHSNIMQFLKTHPFFDPIRGDPRFADLVRRVGLDNSGG